MRPQGCRSGRTGGCARRGRRVRSISKCRSSADSSVAVPLDGRAGVHRIVGRASHPPAGRGAGGPRIRAGRGPDGLVRYPGPSDRCGRTCRTGDPSARLGPPRIRGTRRRRFRGDPGVRTGRRPPRPDLPRPIARPGHRRRSARGGRSPRVRFRPHGPGGPRSTGRRLPPPHRRGVPPGPRDPSGGPRASRGDEGRAPVVLPSDLPPPEVRAGSGEPCAGADGRHGPGSLRRHRRRPPRGGGHWTPSDRTRSRPEDGPRLPLFPAECGGRGSTRDGGCGTSSIPIGERLRDRDGSSLREGRLDAGRIDQEPLRSGVPRVPRPAALRGTRRDRPAERRDDRPGVRAFRVDRDARAPRPPVLGAPLLRLRQLVTCNMMSKSLCNAPSGVVACTSKVTVAGREEVPHEVGAVTFKSKTARWDTFSRNVRVSVFTGVVAVPNWSAVNRITKATALRLFSLRFTTTFSGAAPVSLSAKTKRIDEARAIVVLIGNGKPGMASNAKSRCVPTGAKGWGTKVTIRIATATMPTSFRAGSRRVRSFRGGGCRTPNIRMRKPKMNQPG